MKANELTDGIYVYFNCFDGSKIIVKVTGFKDGVVYGVSKTSSHWCTIEKVEPIPLTPEILEKIDLKIGNVTEYLGYDIYSDEEGTFGVSEDREGFVFETYKRWEEKDCDGAPIDWGFYPVNRIKGIRYFHELQHALRLCRIDKEIIL